MRYAALTSIMFAFLGCQANEASVHKDVATASEAEVAKVVAPAAAAEPTNAAVAPTSDEKAEASGCCGGACGGGGSCGGACGGGSEVAVEQSAADELPAGTEWLTVPVQGMMCGGCERKIIAAVSTIDGIARVEASAGKGEVRLALNGQHKTDLEKLAKQRINALGFTAQ